MTSKTRFLSIILSLSMVVSSAATSAFAVNRKSIEPVSTTAKSIDMSAENLALDANYIKKTDSHWFYDQLTFDGKKIYDALWYLYQTGKMDDGKGEFDLCEGVDGVNNGQPIATQAMMQAYSNGDDTLYLDFMAAKDAFDLDHSEIFWIDSAYITFRTSYGGGKYHAIVGTGRADTYLVKGFDTSNISQAKADVEKKINEIVNGAQTDAEITKLSGDDKVAAQVRYVHDQVINHTSYRFEYECKSSNDYSPAQIRTIYGSLINGESVCEGYARAMQVILTKLGIECVLVHGTNTKTGEPQAHLWNEVKVGEKWYTLDATFDDPVVNKDSTDGKDGGERYTYCLVGGNTVGLFWLSSPILSPGNFEFVYPSTDIASVYSAESYGTNELSSNDPRLVVTAKLNDKGTQNIYSVSFGGMGVNKAAENHYYILYKSFNENYDGTTDGFSKWYYLSIGLLYSGFDDNDERLSLPATQTYLEFAVTQTEPNPDLEFGDDDYGYYLGDDSGILAQTGKIYNQYNEPPSTCVQRQFPSATGSIAVGKTHHCEILYSHELYPAEVAAKKAEETETHQSNSDTTSLQTSSSTTKHLGNGKAETTFSYQYNDQEYTAVLEWTCMRTEDVYSKEEAYGNTENSKVENVKPHYSSKGMDGITFDFTPSSMWADDQAEYNFNLRGVVGGTNYKEVNGFGWSCKSYVCPICYRNQGYDWNMFAQPTLMDNPGNLNLSSLVGDKEIPYDEYLEQLTKDMSEAKKTTIKEELRGRIALSVTPANGLESDALTDYLEKQKNIRFDENSTNSQIYNVELTHSCQSKLVNDGDSVRMSVGFPGNNGQYDPNVVYKAYHFDYNDDGSIKAVQEIPVQVTPYGLVILCDRFSPFQIVSLDADDVKKLPAEDQAAANSKIISVATTTGGTATITGGTAMNGQKSNQTTMVKLTSSDTATVTITPDAGYAVDSVSVDGKPATVTNNSLTVSYNDVENGLVKITFIAASVQKAEEEKGWERIDVPVHDPTKEPEDHAHDWVDDTVQPTCTTPGKTGTQTCPKCHSTMGSETVIPALGHSPENIGVTEPTCTEKGYAAKTICTRCNETIQGGHELAALGHNFVGGICTRCNEADPDFDGSDVQIPVISTGSIPIKVSASVDGSVATISEVDTSALTGSNAAGSDITVDLTRCPSVDTVKLPAAAVQEFSKANILNLLFRLDSAVIDFNEAALDSISSQAKSTDTLELKAQKRETKELLAPQQSVIAKWDVPTSLNVSLSSGTQKISSFGKGSVSIEVPIVISANHDPKEYSVWYVSDKGLLAKHQTTYKNNCLFFDVSHFSDYIVVREPSISCKKNSNCPLSRYADSAVDEWYHDGVHYMLNTGLMIGMNSTEFAPNIPLTRAMVAQMLYANAKSPSGSPAAAFSDTAGQWFTDAVNWAAANKIVVGYEDGTFRPNNHITRQELAAILYSAAGKPGYAGTLDAFPDASSVQSWAADALSWATSFGLISGNTSADGKVILDPTGKATRAQAATIIMQYLKRIA